MSASDFTILLHVQIVTMSYQVITVINSHCDSAERHNRLLADCRLLPPAWRRCAGADVWEQECEQTWRLKRCVWEAQKTTLCFKVPPQHHSCFSSRRGHKNAKLTLLNFRLPFTLFLCEGKNKISTCLCEEFNFNDGLSFAFVYLWLSLYLDPWWLAAV